MGLNLVNVQPSDRGEYDCVWANRAGYVKSVIILTVVEPPSILQAPKLSIYPEGGELELSCNATGYPAPSIEWLINGETLSANKNLEIKGSTLYISLVEKKHAGIVQCVASNEYGSHSGYNYLRVTPKQHVGGSSKSRNDFGLTNNGHKHTRVGGRRRGKNGKRKESGMLGKDCLLLFDNMSLADGADGDTMEISCFRCHGTAESTKRHKAIGRIGDGEVVGAG